MKSIVEYVEEHDYTIFPKLLDYLGDEAKGDTEISAVSDPNIILWTGVSDEFADAFITELEAGTIHLVPELPDRYVEYGTWLELAEVVKPPSGGYKTQHWQVASMRAGSGLPTTEEVVE